MLKTKSTIHKNCDPVIHLILFCPLENLSTYHLSIEQFVNAEIFNLFFFSFFTFQDKTSVS